MKKYRGLFFLAFALFVLIPYHAFAKQINIKTPSDNNMILEIEDSDTIEAVKQKIYNQMILENANYPISIEEQILFFNNNVMENGRTIADYGVKVDNTIFLGHKLEVVFDANGGRYGEDLSYKLDNWNAKSYDELKKPIREGYAFKGYFTEESSGETLYEYIDSEGIRSDITFYAQWANIVDKISIDFNDMKNLYELNNNYDLFAAMSFIVSKTDLITEKNLGEAVDENGKTLFTINEQGVITLSNNLTEADNIHYILNENDKNLYLRDEDIESLPNEIEIIFVKKSYKVGFDANGGTFKNGNTLNIDKWENGLENSLEQPTRDGYAFKGFFTEKTDGTKLEMILAESGIDSDMTFYAQWELEQEVPKTLDNITMSILMGTLSLIGLVGATIYCKKGNKVRA